MTRVSASSHRSEHTLQTLDGLRGLAILLVVLSHIWVIYPFDDLHQIAPFDGWFKAGSVAVSIFLVLSGFLVTRSMLDGFDRSGSTGPAASLVRRLLRISAQVGLLLVAVTVVAGIDDTDTASDATTKKSVFAVATYTWNWYVRDNAFEARSDLGHLWYLSVEPARLHRSCAGHRLVGASAHRADGRGSGTDRGCDVVAMACVRDGGLV